MNVIVTTAESPSASVLEQALAASSALLFRYVPRQQYTVAQLQRAYFGASVLVVQANKLLLYSYSQGDEPSVFSYHPSMGFVRAKRMLRGEIDPLIRVSACAPGDTVLDCTAGMAADALVFAMSVGESGRVVALESQPVMHYIVQHGLRTYECEVREVNEALRRIELVSANHLMFLQAQNTASYDIVYFDPMFRKAQDESAALTPLRTLANVEPISVETVEQACRVARRCVVLKEHVDSGEFERLGFKRVTKGQVGYGVIAID